MLLVVDPTKAFGVKIDASASAVGANLLQDDRPNAFESKKLNPMQRNYLAYESNLFVIIHALKQCNHYLDGAKFEVVFDHESVKWFTTQKDLRGCKARWAKILNTLQGSIQ